MEEKHIEQQNNSISTPLIYTEILILTKKNNILKQTNHTFYR